jgi:hypothetical protein
MINKKGSLELSVNAIVVLIIALTILGLVIAFAVTKFTEVSGKLQPVKAPTSTATAEIPVQFPGGSNEITLSKIADSTMSVSVYNSDTAKTVDTVAVTCDIGAAFSFTVPSTTINSGATASIPVLMKTGTTAVGEYACTIDFKASAAVVASSPIFITVK